jgi:thiosulfate dehydrogenase
MSKSLAIILLVISLAAISFGLWQQRFFTAADLSSLDEREARHRFALAHIQTILAADLVDPEQAPLNIRDSIMRGYRLIMNTPFYASKYTGDRLSCTHCHFAEGDTAGGKNNGISLVGVTATYPRYSMRDGKSITLTERINNCFERSLNGWPLPEDSEEMKDILAYLQWISKEVEHFPTLPWLGLQMLKSTHQPNPKEGEKVYRTYCAMCHKQDGEGGEDIPPIWGQDSFNDGAGMSHLPMLASFIYWNMPYKNAVLSEEQSLDVAAFVLQQPRPHFQPKE